MKVKSIQLKNFKGFENINIILNSKTNIIIGENNIGKSSLFEAILLWKKCFDNIIQSNKNSFYKIDKAGRYIPFNADNLIALSLEGVDLRKESQDIYPYHKDSIQYYFANYIKDRFDVIYDDDYSGEMADLIGFNIEEKQIHIHLFPLKYAHNGEVSNKISNFYEVCGQAEKCIKWRNRGKENELFDHLFRRIRKTLKKESVFV